MRNGANSTAKNSTVPDEQRENIGPVNIWRELRTMNRFLDKIAGSVAIPESSNLVRTTTIMASAAGGTEYWKLPQGARFVSVLAPDNPVLVGLGQDIAIPIGRVSAGRPRMFEVPQADFISFRFAASAADWPLTVVASSQPLRSWDDEGIKATQGMAVTKTAASAQPVVTPSAPGRSIRLHGYSIELSRDAAIAAGALVQLNLLDGVTVLNLRRSVYIPTASVTTTPGTDSGPWVDLGDGVLLSQGSALQASTTATLTAGHWTITVAFSEE